jgi:hypothetical protein
MKQFNLKETLDKINEIYKSKEFADIYYMQSKRKKRFGDWFFKWYGKRVGDELRKIDLNTKDIRIHDPS